MSLDVFTSAACNYIPKARVLAASVKAAMPKARFHLLLADPLPAGFDVAGEPFDSVIDPRAIDPCVTRAWVFSHSVVELCTAVKGLAFQHLLSRGAERVVYLDPDTFVLSRFDELFELLEHAPVAATPHLLSPESEPAAIVDNEIACLRHGVYNLGFLACKADAGARRFIDWWAERLRVHCYDDICFGLFTDQRWVDLAPALFGRDFSVLREPGYNVAVWNISRRRVEGDPVRGWTVEGKPLRFYHFTGLDSGENERMLARYGADNPALAALHRYYLDRLRSADRDGLSQRPYGYGRFDNGEAISSHQRRLYRRHADLREAFPDPFSSAGDSFLAWYRATGRGIDRDPADELRERVAELESRLAQLQRSPPWWRRWLRKDS